MKYLRLFWDLCRRLRQELSKAYSTSSCKVFLAFNGVRFGPGLKVRGVPLIQVHRAGQLTIGANCRFNSGYHNNFVGGEQRFAIQVLPGGCLTLGDGAAVSNSTIVCANSITIEKNVFIGGGCHIYDTDFHSLILSERVGKVNEQIKKAPIKLKRGSFIGAHSTILRGVEIGECSIVAAGSVVVKSIPDHELWGGAPARFLRQLTPQEIEQPV